MTFPTFCSSACLSERARVVSTLQPDCSSSGTGSQQPPSSNVMSPSASPGESPAEQAPDAGVPPPPAHVAPDAAAVVDLLEESSGQQDPDSSRRRPPRRLKDFIGGRREGSPDQLSPDDSGGIPRPPPVQRRPVGGRRDQDGPDLLFPSSGSRRPAEGRLGGAQAGHWLPQVVGFSILTFNSAMAAYRSWGDADAISFIVPTYFIMVSLFISLKLFLAARPNSRRRNGLMVCVWILTMALTSGFVYQIAGATAKPTLQLSLLLWAMPAATGASVFIIFWDRFGAPQGEELPDVPLGEELV